MGDEGRATRTVDAFDELVEGESINTIDSSKKKIEFECMLLLELLSASGNDDVAEGEGREERRDAESV